jgi:hypothetical protein
MNRLPFIMLAVSCLLWTGRSSAQMVTNASNVGQIYTSEFTVNSRPDTVMMCLGNPDTLAKVMGLIYQGGAKRLFHVGDAIMMIPQKERYNDRDTGVVILTYLKMRTEMRMTFEPENGNCYFEDQYKLFPAAGNGTRIVFTERYFEPASQSEGVISEQARLLREGLARLKSSVERK